LYVWVNGAWKNCGNVSPDLKNYITVTDLNNGLSSKADISAIDQLKTGLTNQVSTLQTQVDNSAAGTNLLTGTSSDWVSRTTSWHILRRFYYTVTSDMVGNNYTFSAEHQDSSNGGVRLETWYEDLSGERQYIKYSNNSSTAGTVYVTFTVTSSMVKLELVVGTNNENNQVENIRHEKLEKGNLATDWCPNPADKVNVSDMRKPASEVVGLEDVSQAVLKSNLISGTDLNTITESGIYPYSNVTLINGSNFDGLTWGYLQVINQSDMVFQKQFGTGISTYAFRKRYGSPAVWSNWAIITDDSKVAHLSGANKFDTVPTVNNNPLLLASSLPSDLARTGSDQEFTGKNTFDTAPIDKTTGNPYITKDGVPAVPSTFADTTKDANFTGKLQKSGIDVATKSDVTTAVNTATASVATTDDLNNYYHANASDDLALSAAKSAKVPGIFWFEEA